MVHSGNERVQTRILLRLLVEYVLWSMIGLSPVSIVPCIFLAVMSAQHCPLTNPQSMFFPPCSVISDESPSKLTISDRLIKEMSRTKKYFINPEENLSVTTALKF